MIKPGRYGAAIGAVLEGVIGFTWGGWVTGWTAADRAMTMSRNDVVASMVPICLNMARTDPDRMQEPATIRDAWNFEQRGAPMETG